MFKIILHEYIKVKPNGNTTPYYRKLGYKFKLGDEILVKTIELTDGSKVVEERKCDRCGEIFQKKHIDILKTFQTYGEDYCCDCLKEKRKEKTKETNLKRYGVENPLQNKKIREKMQNTCLEKYGVDNAMKLKETQEKSQNTCLKNHGVKYPMQNKKTQEKSQETLFKNYGVLNPNQSKEIHEKAQKTCLEKYGVDNPFKSEEIKEKIAQTLLDKYGVNNPMKSKEIKEKAMNTLNKNGTTPTSEQQIKVFEICKDLYPENEIILNAPTDSFMLDILVKINDIKIDVEYDGWYWHQDKEKDNKRDKVIGKLGYKILRIRSGNLVPNKEEINDAIQKLLNTNINKIEIFLSDWKN